MENNLTPEDGGIDFEADYLSYEGRKMAEEEADRRQEEMFCKLDGGCLDPEAEDEKLLVKLGIEVKAHEYTSVENQFLEGDYIGINFLGEPIYKRIPLICVQQLNNDIGSNNILFQSGYRKSIFSIDIKTPYLDGPPDRDTLLEIEDMCYKIKELLKPKDGSKEK